MGGLVLFGNARAGQVPYVCFLGVLAVVDTKANDEVGRWNWAQQLFRSQLIELI